jgi:hypothetical protein
MINLYEVMEFFFGILSLVQDGLNLVVGMIVHVFSSIFCIRRLVCLECKKPWATIQVSSPDLSLFTTSSGGDCDSVKCKHLFDTKCGHGSTYRAYPIVKFKRTNVSLV